MLVNVKEVRDRLVTMVVVAGEVARRIKKDDTKIVEKTTIMLKELLQISSLLGIDIKVAMEAKMELNKRKCPVEACLGDVGKQQITKHSAHSEKTGISVNGGQSVIEWPKLFDNVENSNPLVFCKVVDALTRSVVSFGEERKFDRFHTKKTLLLVVMSELGELTDAFVWMEDCEPLVMKKNEMDKIVQELADVAMCLLNLADASGGGVAKMMGMMGSNRGKCSCGFTWLLDCLWCNESK